MTLDFLPDWEEQNKVARGPKTCQKDSWRKAIKVKKAAKLKTSKLFLGFWHAHHSIFLYIGLSRTVSTYRWLDIRLEFLTLHLLTERFDLFRSVLMVSKNEDWRNLYEKILCDLPLEFEVYVRLYVQIQVEYFKSNFVALSEYLKPKVKIK